MAHAPPVVRLALAFAAGAAWVTFGAPLWLLPLSLLLLPTLPIPTWGGPTRPWIFLGVAATAGALAAGSALAARSCPEATPGAAARVEGRLLAAPRSGSAPFVGLDGCGPVTVVLGAVDAPAGRTLVLDGVWREGTRTTWFRATQWSLVEDSTLRVRDASARWTMVRWRDHLVARLERLYGARAPLVSALVLARREGFDPALRDTFARTGLAHLLAISGFHVGVIAGLAFAALRSLGVRPRRARLGSASLACVYVALIGFPDAACRAALILVFLAVSTARGRPPARWGALASALLVLVVLDPGRIASPGFQLSFAGAGGLVGWARPLAAAMRHGRWGPSIPEPIAGAVAAGIAATLATLPVVAWHFEQVSVVGVPATLVAGPLVALALPGAIASLALDFVAPGAARFLAGGVGALLYLLEAGATALGAQGWIAVWASRTTVVAGLVGVLVATGIARHPRIRGPARRILSLAYAGAFILAWPLGVSLHGRGSVDVVVLDVGQGDAVALRSPDGRWVLIDTGPPARTGDPRGHPVVRALRARGVRRLEALVLTHADLDHIGGATSVLASLEVGVVYDPGLPAAKDDFVEVLLAARARGVRWLEARRGTRVELGDLHLEVLSPSDSLVDGSPEANEASVVIRARYGSFDALLTGDAYKDVERALAPELGPGIEVLKVGHHGSDTSTDPALLDGIRPEVALVSVGRDNRYHHPRPEVLARLLAAGVEIRRTDQEGTLTVTARKDGRFSVRGARAGPGR